MTRTGTQRHGAQAVSSAGPRATHTVLLAALLSALSLPAFATPPAIPLDGFDDAVHHWQNVHGRDYPRYAPGQIREIADNLLRYQRADGGWPVNHDPLRILDAAERAQLAQEQAQRGGSFDNRNVYTQVEYLAAAFARTGDTRYRDAARRGLDFILARQIGRCGGWPHSVPARESYHPLITFADDVTSGVLATLRRAMAGDRAFAFLDADARTRIAAAVQRGDECILALQVRQDGAPAGWAGQYDPASLQPAQGRSFELPSQATQETVGVLRYLMSIPAPSPQVRAAIDGGVAWLRKVQLHGMRLETFSAPVEQYRYHNSHEDNRLVADAAAPPLWARFYDVRDNSVVLATREGRRVDDYTQIPRERRTGYRWYGDWPQALLQHEYPRWQAAQRAH